MLLVAVGVADDWFPILSRLPGLNSRVSGFQFSLGCNRGLRLGVIGLRGERDLDFGVGRSESEEPGEVSAGRSPEEALVAGFPSVGEGLLCL